MPQGYEERFKYGDRMTMSSNSPAWACSFAPLIGYEAVYSYRSGARSKNMTTQGSYRANVIEGKNLRDKILARKQFLEDYIKQSFEPTNGPPSVFSLTDNGHPFATFKVDTHRPYGKITFREFSRRTDWDVSVSPTGLPYPNLSDPFGVGLRTSDTSTHPLGKQTYFVWPGHLFGGGKNAPTGQQVISNGTKQTIGAGCIASANPRAAKADLAITVLELLTGNLPRILARIGDNLTRIAIDWKLQTGKELRKHTNPGNEWLSYHFGWAPLVKDVFAAIDVLYRLHVLLYASDDTRRHRGGDLATLGRNTESSTSPLAHGGAIGTNTFLSPQVKDFTGTFGAGWLDPVGVRVSKSVLIEADFRFAARYHSGARPNSREQGYLDKALDLLGLDITPATLWNLAPWTWLLDWFSNIGTVAQNLSDLDWSNVLLDYAYLTTVVKTTSSIGVNMPASWSSGRYTTSTPFIAQRWVTTEKVREQASPYGFSVSWTGLNPFQLSILAALGMTRGR